MEELQIDMTIQNMATEVDDLSKEDLTAAQLDALAQVASRLIQGVTRAIRSLNGNPED